MLTLQEYADDLGASIETVLKKAWRNGVKIKNNPRGRLDENVIDQLDSIFYSCTTEQPLPLKGMRNSISQLERQERQPRVEKSLEKQSGGRKQISKKSNMAHRAIAMQDKERVIGLVKFFDSNKGFGFAVTNRNRLGHLAANRGDVVDFYLNYNSFENDSGRDVLEWVVFTPSNEKQGLAARHIKELSCDGLDLRLAMSYHGTFARIKGTDKKGGSHDVCVLSSIINSLWKRGDYSTGCQIILDSFAEYLVTVDNKEEVIKEYLQDPDLCKVLISMYPKMKGYENDQPSYKEVINQFACAIRDVIFTTDDISVFDKLPSDFDYASCGDEVVDILEKSIQKPEGAVTRWLRTHPRCVNGIAPLVKSLDLRYAIFECTNDVAIFCTTDLVWNEVYDWLRGKSQDLAMNFLLSRFLDADETLVVQSGVLQYLDEDAQNDLICRLLKERKYALPLLRILVCNASSIDLDVISTCLRENIDVLPLYPRIVQRLDQLVRENEPSVRQFLDSCEKSGTPFERMMKESDIVSDELLLELFVHDGDIEHLNSIQNFDMVPGWFNTHDDVVLQRFLKNCQKIFTDEEDRSAIAETISALLPQKFHAAIKEESTDEQYKILQLCSRQYANEIVANYFSSTALFDVYVGEQWQKLKEGVDHVAFDLESDGETIREFAFWEKGNIKAYQDEEQLNSLLLALRRTKMIVGHRIKEWDLKILKSKGFDSHAFFWDTLEIEILLDPCRYSYVLRTDHVAENDVEQTEKLFWSQLFRLAQDEGLCNELKSFLPPDIVNVLDKLRQPIFASFFAKSSEYNQCFFQILADVEEDVKTALSGIDGEGGRPLILAPKRLWTRISEFVDLSFIQSQEGIDLLAIQSAAVDERPFSDPFLNAILRRFIARSKSPIVANLAQYIRLNYLPDECLTDYVGPATGRIACVEPDIVFKQPDLMGQYDRVYFVGCEIENRLNQYAFPERYTPTKFWEEKSSIPMRLGASNCVAVSREERCSKLFEDVPEEAANIWIEQVQTGDYIINYNFDFYGKLRSLAQDGTLPFATKNVSWRLKKEVTPAISLVYSTCDKDGFAAPQYRVSATSRYRATYWAYQFALLRRLRETQGRRPIVLILDDILELEDVVAYARDFGFNVPVAGSLAQRLELITHHSNGMVIIDRASFFTVVDLRLETPYCYVWDHMAVEKHMMMWHGFVDERNKSFLRDGIEARGEHSNIEGSMDTYQSILCSLWPVYEYYYAFIRANCPESSMFVLDSFFDDYHDLASTWDVKACEMTNLWRSKEDFDHSVDKARRIFAPKEAVTLKGSDVQTAMDVILETLVKCENVPNPVWSSVQQEVLPKILSREENYLVSMPTGGGKSVLFQGPALYNAVTTNRLSVVVTPLKALMEDQVKELGVKGFISNVDYLNGDRSYQEVKSIYKKIRGGELALLYVTPERFRSREFLNALSMRMENDRGLEYMIFDEAHCISQWGMEFRPEYLNVVRKCREYQKLPNFDMCVAMFSATVTDMIYDQINAAVPVIRLGQGAGQQRNYNPIRDHIGMSFEAIAASNDQARLNKIVDYVNEKRIDPRRSRMLVFCRTRKQCEEVAQQLEELKRNGVLKVRAEDRCIGYFHAGMDGDEREDAYNRFKDEDDPLCILCATKAFGMGMDIPNIHYLVHFSPPSVLEDYLQEVGRAGRNRAMYEAVGFSSENPIPAMCICSPDDIKKAHDLLLLSELSWKNVEEIRTSVEKYISQISSLEKAKDNPIVVPNTLWARDEHDHDFTAFKLGLYWLEQMGRFKLGYLSSPHIVVNLNAAHDHPSVGTSSQQGKRAERLFNELRRLQGMQQSQTIQVSLQEVAAKFSWSRVMLLDVLLWCEKHGKGYFRIEQKVRCQIAFTRLSEVEYMFSKLKTHEVAFHVILKAARALLGSQELRIEKCYSLTDIREIVQAEDTLQEIVKEVRTTKEETDPEGNVTEKECVKEYMVWYDENDKDRNKGLSIAESYHNDLYGKRVRQIVSLLGIIPGVKVCSYLDTTRKCVLQSVVIERTGWRDFLNSFEADCLRLLKYVYQESQGNGDDIRWSGVVVNLDLADKGFSYFENILRYLAGMAYVKADPLLPSGVEVYATDDAESPIRENMEETSPDVVHKVKFDEAQAIRELRLHVMDALTSRIKGDKSKFQELLNDYFAAANSSDLRRLLSKYFDDDDEIWNIIRKKAITDEEEKLKGNPEQWAIYSEDSDVNVNVEAGPGSGKTHILTLKCAKLIYRQHVDPKSILVLAYNRAVVVELKSRLVNLFAKLGLSRSAAQLHVYTFHGLAKRICRKETLEGREMREWEKILCETIRTQPNEIRAVIPNLRYVFIDEFQDITQVRLDSMFALQNIYSQLTFFTIGDKDQSIYGFDKKANGGSGDPDFYYKQLYENLQRPPKQMTMTTNYRSYPKILEEAKCYLAPTSHAPKACTKNIEESENKEDYVRVYSKTDGHRWFKDFETQIQELKKENVKDVAVFFRTNNEVYRGYSQIRGLNIDGIRIRVQGASSGEIFRVREIYSVLKYLEINGHQKITFHEGGTEDKLKKIIGRKIDATQALDAFYLDFVFVLILDYLDMVMSDENEHTYAEMANSVRETLREDNSQLYKLYEDSRFASRRICSDPQLNVVLTTMHKVKGLEFDAVIVTPSFSSLGCNSQNGVAVQMDAPLSESEIEDILEEQRLLYVAYTRAKKYLFAYRGDREAAVKDLKRFRSDVEEQFGIHERDAGLKNYYLGYNADQYAKEKDEYIASVIKKNDPVSVKRIFSRMGNPVYYIIHGQQIIGRLSKNSSIAQRMTSDDIDCLEGFFVSDVFCWTYDESLAYDQEHQTTFSNKWNVEARQKGYTFIVDIAGYGQCVKEEKV